MLTRDPYVLADQVSRVLVEREDRFRVGLFVVEAGVAQGQIDVPEIAYFCQGIATQNNGSQIMVIKISGINWIVF